MNQPGGTHSDSTGGESTGRSPSAAQPGGQPPGSRDPGTTQRLAVLEKPPQDTAHSATAHPQGEAPARARRFWSPRRVPAGVVALLLLAGSGLLLYDIAGVRAGREAMQWRRTLADELATRPLDDVAVLAGAATATALGLGLLLCALTPGLRSLLPMRTHHADVRAGLHRGAVTLVLRDRATEVSGVWSAGVHTSRRTVRVRVLSHFRELDDVQADLHIALAGGIRDLGLAQPPAMTVRVARVGRQG
jgi:hypothetical protein